MSLAVLTCSYPTNTRGGRYLTANTWQTVPMNSIESQFNTNGGGTNFCTLTAIPTGSFVLTSGRYRIDGWMRFWTRLPANTWQARITNISNPSKSIAFGSSVTSGARRSSAASPTSGIAHVMGEFATSGEKFSMQVYTSIVSADDQALGIPSNIAGIKECYAYLEIHKIY